jgi:hypothetical protein
MSGEQMICYLCMREGESHKAVTMVCGTALCGNHADSLNNESP